METGDQVVRLLLMQMRGVTLETQADAIRGLGEANYQARIAELLDTTPGTVKVTLARANRGNAKREKAGRGEGEGEGEGEK